MSDGVRFSDQEIDSILRMARESGTFFSGLIAALVPQEAPKPREDAQAAAPAEQN
jgi:hypothetical protein